MLGSFLHHHWINKHTNNKFGTFKYLLVMKPKTLLHWPTRLLHSEIHQDRMEVKSPLHSSKALLTKESTVKSPSAPFLTTPPATKNLVPKTNKSDLKTTIKILPRTKQERIQKSPSKTEPYTPYSKSGLTQTLLPFLSFQPPNINDDTWGHSLSSIDQLQTFHILLQNPNGIQLYDNAYQYKYGLSLCKSYGIGAFCATETKLNSDQFSC
jgi:hypothetical protein